MSRTSADTNDKDTIPANSDGAERYNLIAEIATNMKNRDDKYEEEQDCFWDSDDVNVDLEEYISLYS